MDILTALAGTTRGRTTACKIQRWLDSIDGDTEGKADLVAAFTTTDPNSVHYRTLPQLLRIGRALDFHTSSTAVGHHRTGKCSCLG